MPVRPIRQSPLLEMQRARDSARSFTQEVKTMTTSKGFAFLLALSVCSGLASAHDKDRNNCREVRALIVDTSAPADCPSPYRFCAAGTVEGNRGLNGTTYFVLDGV